MQLQHELMGPWAEETYQQGYEDRGKVKGRQWLPKQRKTHANPGYLSASQMGLAVCKQKGGKVLATTMHSKSQKRVRIEHWKRTGEPWGKAHGGFPGRSPGKFKVIVCERENEALWKVKKCKEDRKSEMSGIQEVGMQEIWSLRDCRYKDQTFNWYKTPKGNKREESQRSWAQIKKQCKKVWGHFDLNGKWEVWREAWTILILLPVFVLVQ